MSSGLIQVVLHIIDSYKTIIQELLILKIFYENKWDQLLI